MSSGSLSANSVAMSNCAVITPSESLTDFPIGSDQEVNCNMEPSPLLVTSPTSSLCKYFCDLQQLVSMLPPPPLIQKDSNEDTVSLGFSHDIKKCISSVESNSQEQEVPLEDITQGRDEFQDFLDLIDLSSLVAEHLIRAIIFTSHHRAHHHAISLLTLEVVSTTTKLLKKVAHCYSRFVELDQCFR